MIDEAKDVALEGIIYDWFDIVDFLYQCLPVKTGMYCYSKLVFVYGSEVSTTLSSKSPNEKTGAALFDDDAYCLEMYKSGIKNLKTPIVVSFSFSNHSSMEEGEREPLGTSWPQ